MQAYMMQLHGITLKGSRDALLLITHLNGVVVPPSETFRCQEKPFIDTLNAGIRAFDLRFASDTTNTSLVFYRSQALLSEIATVDDVLYGFYRWLDDHPSEALFLSFNYEGSTKEYASDDAEVQMAIFNTLTSAASQRYFVQTKNEFGTLGDARGKITPPRRFPLDQLDQSYSDAIPRVYFSPNQSTDNSPNITLIYNSQLNLTAHIEDFYEIDSPLGSDANLNVQWKYNATTANIIRSATANPNDLFWSFTSSEYDANVPIDTPQIMAIGDVTSYTPLRGVNQKIVPFFRNMTGKGVGIVKFDFYDQPSDLIPTFLFLQNYC
jgi:1-phosphatidylinositol phosphodiesterase